jgi:uncharacterized MAPEG superfamily protein
LSTTGPQDPTASVGAGRQQGAVIVWILIGFPIAIGLWFAVFRFVPPLPGMEATGDRLVFALKCICVAVLFCLVTGVEAVAHERLRSPAIDPLAGYETKRLRVNLRYLQNTLEQLVVFIPGLLGLAIYSPGGGAMRAVLAATLVWIVMRFAFWIGYHFGAAQRGVGAPGLVLGLVMLVYVCARFGYEVAGPWGAAAPVGLFLAIEAVLFLVTGPVRARR